MKAVFAEGHGEPAALRIAELPPIALAAGSVRIAVAAAGVSFVDRLLITGGHQTKLAFPYVPGTECAGTVREVGAAVSTLRPGDRVAAITLPGGALAEQVDVPDTLVWKAPDLPFFELSVLAASYGTAFHALVQRGRVRQGELLVVRGGAGALGTAAIQIGRALGLDVVAFASSYEGRRACLEAGARLALDATSETWRADLEGQLAGKRVDVVFDPVGGERAILAFRTLGWGGRYLTLGFASGTIPSLPFNLALLKGADLVGVEAARFMRDEPDLSRANMAEICRLAERGELRPRIGRVYAMADFAEALDAAAARSAEGRIVLAIAPELQP